MTSTVSAVYQHGVLRPLEALALPELTRVQIQVHSPGDTMPNGYQHTNTFQRRLMILRDLLTGMEEITEDDPDRELLPQILQTDLKMLWHLCQPSHREFCAMLELSAMHLNANHLTAAQIAAFRFGLEIIEQDEITKSDIDTCHDLLTDAGLPPSFSFDEETVQSYLDER